MATIEQATMPYAVGALLKYASLRDLATPALTVTELKDADARCVAVVTLLKSVSAMAKAGTSPAKFIASKAALITPTGLGDADVTTMFQAVGLKKRIDALNEKVSNKTLTVKQAIASIKTGDRLGLGEASLSSYIKKPRNWGENRAGWQRKAVNQMAGNVGDRIRTVSESSLGTALAFPVNQDRLTDTLKGKPIPGAKAALEPIVRAVAQQNNPGEANYGANVWKNYDRLY